MEPLPASFYGKFDEKNPVVASLEQKLNHFMKDIERVTSYRSYTRGASELFCIWNEYEKLLPVHYYQEKLLKIGTFLLQLKFYKLASWQCFGRCLQQFGSFRIDDITDVNTFKTTFLPSPFEISSASLTLHALQMNCICSYYMVKEADSRLLKMDSQRKCTSILKFLRLIMQVALPKEQLCWLIYNGTTYIYTICRHLMVLTLYTQAFEFLLWASICMETSIPLSTVRYLRWRATLYTAVCQCYYDCEYDLTAEVFARRALGKISELSQLETMNPSPQTPHIGKAFREATVKISIMIFKRAVFESRRKPKGILRPKQRTNYKESQNLPWPHNATEHLLAEMFHGSAAQFLAITEALSARSRRVLQTRPPFPPEHEIFDVTTELFLAGLLILSGGAGNTQLNAPACTDPIGGLIKSNSLIELAAAGEDGVSVEAAVRFAKTAFCYEYLEVFDIIVAPLLSFLRKNENLTWKSYELDLDLLIAMEPFVSPRKPKHGLPVGANCSIGGTVQSGGATISCDDLVILAEAMFAYTCTPSESCSPDIDMVVDAVLFLWQKCKTVLQKGNFGVSGSTKFLKKLDNLGKWLHILSILQEVTIWCNLGDIDPVLMVDITLYSAGLLEILADSSVKSKRKPGDIAARETQSDTVTSSQTPAISMQAEHCTPINVLAKHPAEQLEIACKMLEKALDSICMARSATVSTEKSALIDKNCIKVEVNIFQSNIQSDEQEKNDIPQEDSYKAIPLQSFIMDLHLELIQVYYRVAFKFLKISNELLNSENTTSQETIGTDENYGFTILKEADILKKVKKNSMLKAMFLIQKVMYLYSKEQDQSTKYQLLEKATTLLQQVEVEEEILYSLRTKPTLTDNEELDVVPAPILLSRTHNSVIFKPAPFASSKEVYWYRIFGRTATGSILKVRLKDSHLQGTGIQVPAFGECLLEVKDLEPNEKYIFAVAAYSEDGTIIGNGIGETTKPILAYYPLPILTAWTYLCQVAYQLGHYPVSKAAISILWKHFVTDKCLQQNKCLVSHKTDWWISQKSLNNDAVHLASPILLRRLLACIFIDSDISCHEDAVYCDSLSDNGPLYNGQLSRLAKCERILVAIELASWINDVNQALQAVVQCYGLLTPLIFHRIPSTPVVQILLKCLCVLQHVIGVTKQRKQAGVVESLQHMTACITYHLAKVLRFWKEYNLALEVVLIGKEILQSADQEITPEQKAGGVEDEAEAIKNKWESTIEKQKLAIENSMQAKEMYDITSDLKKEGKTELLTGNEAVIYITILYAPVNTAYSAVKKFKGKSRFLEYFVLLLDRLVREENYAFITNWVNEVVGILRKRNDALLGPRKTPGKKNIVKPLKNAAVVLEYHNNPSKKPKREKATMKELMHNFLNNPALKKDSNAERKQRERLENKAKEVFQTLLGPIIRTYLQLKKFNKACMSEMPWRSQLNVLLGILCFNSFMKCYDEECWTSRSMSRYSFLDPDIFTVHNCGGLLIETESDDTGTTYQIPEISLPSLKRNEKPSESAHGWDDGISDSTESAVHTPVMQATTDGSVHAAEERSTPSTCSTVMLDQLNKAFLYFRRAVVLAHRGGHWTALQNTCRLLWNCAHLVMVYIGSIDSSKSDILTTKRVKNIFCLPFNLAAQNLIDMIIQLQNTDNIIKFVDPDGIFSVSSCVGDISDDHGGFSLKFEQPFDNTNVVDLNLMCAITLYSLELLCHQKKWESLAYLAMYFNAVTHERYTQKVTPLLVFAQGQLQQRIRMSNGPVPPQPHFVRAEINSGTIINSRNFIETQLIVTNTAEGKADTIDLERRNMQSEFKTANNLVSVPVNVEVTLSTFRASLINVNYEGSALRHSRKLLALLLAYTQQRRRDIMKRPLGSVGFNATPVPVENAKPADLSNEDFDTFDCILCKPLPWSQVSLVILSYKNTIELLRINGRRSLCAQALHEQGNVHFYAGNRRAAIGCWCQAIDAILNMTDFIHKWKQLESSSSISLEHSKDYSEALLDRAGIWGCLQAGVLSAKIAQFTTSSNFSFRLDCCILSSFLFKGLFRTTFPHPRSDREYASYEIGFDCDVVELIPGIDLFSDRFRADVRSVVGSLDFLLHELYSAQQNLKVLPLFTLYQYFVSVICRDVYRSVWGRILKVRVLADLGLFAEAFDEHSFLLNGQKLPHTLLEGFRSRETKVHIRFDQSRTLLTENLLAVEYLLKIPLPSNLEKLYGPYLVKKFELGRTYLAIKLAETINHIPEKASIQCSTDSTSSHEDEKFIDLDTDANIMTELDRARETARTCQPRKKELDIYSLRYTLSLPQLKDIILSDVQKKLNILVDKLKKEHDLIFANLAPTGLEMVIDAKCQAAAIAFQRLQLAFSAAIALSAVQLLKRSKIFINVKQSNVKRPPALRSTQVKHIPTEDQTNKNLYQDPHNMEARGRLNLNLWLKCRLVVVTALIAQVYGIRLSKGEDDFLDTARLCEEGMEEAKAYGDVETQTEFMLNAVLLDLRLGRLKDRIKVLLEEIINLLKGRQFLSSRAQMILAQTFLQLSDLRKSETLCNSKEAAMQQKINLCLSAQKLIFDQLVSLGESVQHLDDGNIYSLPVLPLKNIYLPQIILMAKIKLRLGNASAQLITCSAKRWDISHWQEILSSFTSALELCKEAASKQIDLEADLLFQKGKVLRQITEINYGKTLEAVNLLMEAINVTYLHDQNLWLIRQSYLELALLFFYLDEVIEKDVEFGAESKVTLKSGIIVVGKQPRKKITGQGRLIEILHHVLRQPSKYKMLAWIAIRAANEVVRVLRNSQILTRDKEIGEESIKHLVQKELPEYIVLDFLASYQDFETENDELLPILTTIQGEKVEEEEEGTKPVAPNEIPNFVSFYRKVAPSLNSVQFLNYNNHLRRLYNINLLPIRSLDENMNGEGPEYPDPKITFTQPSEAQMHGVDIDFLKCAVNDVENGAHTPVFHTDLCLRLALMHSFLKNHLPTYKNTCCAESIPVILYEIFEDSFKFLQFQPEVYTSVFGEYTLTTPTDSFVGQLTPQMSMAVHSTDKELRVQWYLPALAVPPPSCETHKILLVFAYNVKPVTLVSLKTSTLANASCGYKWIHLKRLIALHRKLSALRQKAEAYLQPEHAPSTSLQRSHQRMRQRYIRSEPATNVRKLPSTLEDMVLQLCKEIKELFIPGPEMRTETEVPFELSFDTLEQLEQIFNPAVGYTLKYGSLFKWLISFMELE